MRYWIYPEQMFECTYKCNQIPVSMASSSAPVVFGNFKDQSFGAIESISCYNYNTCDVIKVLII